MQKNLLALAGALLFIGVAHAQSAGVVNLSVTPTSGTSSVTPKLTWSTSPTAQSCTASGGWSGSKAASGTQTLSAVRANTNFTLTCTWGTGSANVSWVAPTKNSDGSNLTDLASFKVMYGTSSTSLTRTASVTDPTRRTTTLSSLTPATWYFKVRAINSKGVESGDSNVASKSVTGATAAKTVSVTVGSTGGRTTTSTNVWDMTQKNGQWVRRSVIGHIPLGKPCYAQFGFSKAHYLINRSDVTRFYGTPSSTNLVVLCE
jgi:hypothetical protein